jgi:ATP-binding cassette subfamily B protein
VTLTVGGIFVYFEYISIGTLFAYILYVSFFMQPIRRLLMLFEQIQRGTSGIERFFGIMDEEVEIQDGKLSYDEPNGKIEFKQVYFKYEDHTELVFNGLDLVIEPGQTVALVGESGVGKTTITKLIPRLYDVTAGTIEIDGHDIKDYKLNSLRGHIGHVQQDVFIMHGTVYDNILYGRHDASEEEVIEAAKLANIHDFILTLPNGYQTDVGERGVKLSGGQKQRISLARVFLKNPPILILDEATSALDNQTERLIQESIEKVANNRTTVIVAHRLTTIQNSDRILVFTDDGIVEDVSHK